MESALDFTPAMAEMEGDSDRAAGIVAASLVDSALKIRLTAAMRPDPTVHNEIFQPSGSLAALGTKARLAYMLSFVSDDVYQDLIAIERIRNSFAHRADIQHFAHPDIQNEIKRMKTPALAESELNGGLSSSSSKVIWDADPRTVFLAATKFVLGQILPRGIPAPSEAEKPV
ncbi:MAG: hypothetical protein HOH89_00950 [Alphaproteobacteria bacterium]|nr:hypothetical protein [Alphaproteobacteria bacterium]